MAYLLLWGIFLVIILKWRYYNVLEIIKTAIRHGCIVYVH